MKRPYLIQRLEPPYKTDNSIFGDANIFSFGCGYKNGGLSDNAMKLMKDIFRFDYMGSAEFEFGALPEAFQKLLMHQENNVSTELICTTKEGNTALVYIICKKDDLKEIQDYLTAKAHNEWDKKLHTKESVRLQSAINKDTNVCGWIELDTGFMFFTDKDMFNKTKTLLGVK